MKVEMSDGRVLSRERVEAPFGGLFGSISQQKVLQEVVADPYSTYTPADLTELTELTEPTVREAVNALLELGILRNVSRRAKRPLYQVNLESRRIVALTLLTYATLDDEYGENHMDDAIRYYCEMLHSSYVSYEPQEAAGITEKSYWDVAKEAFSANPALIAAGGA